MFPLVCPQVMGVDLSVQSSDILEGWVAQIVLFSPLIIFWEFRGTSSALGEFRGTSYWTVPLFIIFWSCAWCGQTTWLMCLCVCRVRSVRWSSSCSSRGPTTRCCPTLSSPYYVSTAWSPTGTSRTARDPSPSTACQYTQSSLSMIHGRVARERVVGFCVQEATPWHV